MPHDHPSPGRLAPPLASRGGTEGRPGGGGSPTGWTGAPSSLHPLAPPARLSTVLRAGSWKAKPVDRLLLDYDGRHRRRIVLMSERGVPFLLDLPEATHLRGGDGLALEGGGVVEVVARPEPLLEVTAATPEALVRLAWHIGNRHLAAAISADRILIRRDHVIAHMLEHQGATVREVEAPFDPEGGAYHGHGHGDHDHGD